MDNAHAEIASFTPVPVAPRADGWTPPKQAAFIEALAATACVATAAAQVGMSRESAYRLRARDGAEGFREAWEAAVDYAYHRLGEAAFDRALNGVPVPIFYRGEKVGERRHFDERLTQFLLRMRDPIRYTPMTQQIGFQWEFPLETFAARVHEGIARLLAPARAKPPKPPARR